MKEIEFGIKEQAYDAAFVPLHSLKGTCSNFCSSKLEDTCDRMLMQLKSNDWQQDEIKHEQLAEQYWKLDEELRYFVKEYPILTSDNCYYRNNYELHIIGSIRVIRLPWLFVILFTPSTFNYIIQRLIAISSSRLLYTAPNVSYLTN